MRAVSFLGWREKNDKSGIRTRKVGSLKWIAKVISAVNIQTEFYVSRSERLSVILKSNGDADISIFSSNQVVKFMNRLAGRLALQCEMLINSSISFQKSLRILSARKGLVSDSSEVEPKSEQC